MILADCLSKKHRSRQYCLVGDPIDVVTGANIDEALDFKLTGPLTLEWWRHYNSAHNDQLIPLGWGHTHEYHRWLEYDIDGLSYFDPTGNVVNFERLEDDGASSQVDTLSLVRLNATTYHLHENRQPVLEFVFHSEAEPARLVRLFQNEHQIRFFYHPDGRLKGLVDALGRRIRVDTTHQGLITGLHLLTDEYPKGRPLLLYRYDEQGCLLEGTDPYGHSFSFAYDTMRRVKRKTDRRAYSFNFEYNHEGRCTRSVGEDGLLDTRLEYRPLEKRTLVTRADGGEWIYNYDDYGLINSIIDPYGGIQQFRYDEQGRLCEEIDPNGNSSTWIYTAEGESVGKLDSLGRIRSKSDDEDEPLSSDHKVATSALEWELGNLFLATDILLPENTDPALRSLPIQLQNLICTAPDVKKRKQYAATGGRVFNQFALQLKQFSIEGDASRRFSYDPNGNLSTYTDYDGKRQAYHYCHWNLMSHCDNAQGERVSYRYTAQEKIAALLDRGGNKSEYRYDLKDRLIEVHRLGVLKERYYYDQADNLTAKTNGNGDTLVSYEYGPANLLQVRRLASGENHYFEYDANGRFTAVATDNSRTEFGYDQSGNKNRDQRDGLGVEHRFDAVGRVIETNHLERFKVHYQYAQGAVAIIDPIGNVHRITALGNGLFLREFSNGSSEYSQYDGNGRNLLKAVFPKHSDHKLWSRVYRYSGEGDLLSSADSLSGIQSYSYDDAHRLCSTTRPDRHVIYYEYDAGGNLLSQPELDNVAIAAGNRLHQANHNLFDYLFDYNERHNISRCTGSAGETRYFYDAKDMLVRCELANTVWSADYDPLGRRTSKFWQDRRTNYYWDTDRLAAEIKPDGSVRLYIYAAPLAMTPLLFIDYPNLDADAKTGRCYCVLSNQIGAPLQIEDQQGAIVWQAQIEPYGVMRISKNATIEYNLRFPGHYYDNETRLHYNRFRYYSPSLGRYLQSDPMGIMGGFNLYAYSASPLAFVDVRGLTCEACEAGTTRAAQEGIEHEQLPKPSELPKSNRTGQEPPFSDISSFKDRDVQSIRQELASNGFHQTQHERTQTVQVPVLDAHGNQTGTRDRVVTDSKGGSEIWMRRNQDDSYEVVRIDQHGHERPSHIPHNESFTGEPPHTHREHIPNNEKRRLNAREPQWDKERAGEKIFNENSTNGDVANRYNEKFTPGVYDTYDDKGNKTNPKNFPANHTPVQGRDD